MTYLGKRINGIRFPIMSAYHGKAGDATLHRVVLLMKWEFIHYYNLFLSLLPAPTPLYLLRV